MDDIMPVKFIEVDSCCAPFQWRPTPYMDDFRLYIDNNLVDGSPFPGRAAPDPFVWDNQSKTWRMAFGWVALGEYQWECWYSPKHGKALQINGMGPVPTRYPDQNNGGQWVAKDVELHTGFNPTWAGSAACLCLDPKYADEWWSNFQIGDTGQIRIIDTMPLATLQALEGTTV
jgi:hypothetical protein